MTDQPEDRTIHERISDALTADVEGGFVTTWFLIANTIDEDGTRDWSYYNAPDQQLQDSMGLIEYARGALKYEQIRDLEKVWRRDGDEDL